MKNNISKDGRLRIIEASLPTRIRQKQEKALRIESYNLDPKRCKKCAIAISYESRKNTYCSISCSSSCNNVGVSRNHRKHKDMICLNCKAQFYHRNRRNCKFCKVDCRKEYKWNILKKWIEDHQEMPYEYADKRHSIRKYLLEIRGLQCEICKISKWMNKDCPLVVDHIDGRSDNNRIANLRLICPNCDAQTPTFTGRNKGHGRISRRKRYLEEKRIMASE